MSVRLDGDIIRLEGDCHVEEAEALVGLLQQDPARTVDLGGCRRLHSAIVQALLSLSARVTGTPDDPFLRDLVAPNLLPPAQAQTA